VISNEIKLIEKIKEILLDKWFVYTHYNGILIRYINIIDFKSDYIYTYICQIEETTGRANMYNRTFPASELYNLVIKLAEPEETDKDFLKFCTREITKRILKN